MSAQSLPLFPLKTVLFPRMPLPLRVFEERYKRMISNCLKEERPFGVVLIREGEEVGGAAIPEDVGTIARIHAIEPLDDGRYNLFTEGTTRFRIREVHQNSEPYLVGAVETLVDEPGDPSDVEPIAERTRTLFREYFDILVQYAGVDMPGYELPEAAEELSFVMAAVVQAEVSERQSFLEMTDTAGRLRRLHSLLEGDVERLRRASDRTTFAAQHLPAGWKDQFISRN